MWHVCVCTTSLIDVFVEEKKAVLLSRTCACVRACACVLCSSYISALLRQPGQPLHQVRDEDDVHYVGEQRRPAGERHQLLPQRVGVVCR